MSIYDKNLFGMSKYETALERIKSFCTGKRGLCAFSGGKDSQVCYHLLKDCGLDFKAQYSITRFEPPELLSFVRDFYPDVTFRRAYSMPLVKQIEATGLPNRWARWCCDCKHAKTEGFDIAVIGIRWEESPRRRDRWRIFGFKPDKTAYICPVADWSVADVWEYLADRPHCSLYDEGFSRIGCVCCPLSSHLETDSKRWPKTAAMLRMGADKYVARMRRQGFVKANGDPCSDWYKADNPEAEYFNRWLKTGQTAKPVYDIPPDEECLFAGSGFSESDGIDQE